MNGQREVAGRYRPSGTVIVAALTLVAIVSAAVFRSESPGDYAFFVTAFHNLVDRDGLFVYRWTANVQTGPVSLLAYGACSALGRAWFTPVVAVVGSAVVWATAHIGRRRGLPLRPVVLALGGLLTLLEWRSLGRWGHLDDALALASAVAALAAHEHRRPRVAALVLGVSLAIKPWAVMFLPLAIDPASLTVVDDARVGAVQRWRHRLSGPVVALVTGGAFWLPFVVASPDTLNGIRPQVSIAADSVLHLVTRQWGGVPAGLRVAQLLLGLAVVLWTVRRGHPSCALLAGVAVRLLFEAATWPYYTAALVAGAFLWDAHESRARWPRATIATVLLLLPPWWFEAPDLRAALRLVACVGALELVRRTLRRSTGSAEGGAGTAGGGEDLLVEFDAETGTVGQLDPAAV